MNEAAKKRLIGAAVLVLLMVIFVPMLFEEEAPEQTAPDPELGLAPPPPAATPPRPVEVLPPASVADDNQSLGADEMLPFDMMSPPAEPMPPLGPLPPLAEEAAPSAPTNRPAPPLAAERAAPRPAETRAAPGSKPTPPAPTARSGNYVVQVAALSTAEGAAGLEQQLRQKGFSAFTEKAVVNGKTYYRVRVRADGDRARADQLAAAVKQATGHQGQVLVRP